MLGRVEEVEDVRTFDEVRQVRPVVAACVRDLHDRQVGTQREHVREILRQRVLQRELLRFGAAAEADRGDEVSLRVAERERRAPRPRGTRRAPC